jgi:hypothetical protein
LTEISKILKSSGTTAEQKKILEGLIPFIKKYNMAAEEKAASALNDRVQGLIYAAYDLRNISLRRNVAYNNISRAAAEIKKIEAELKKPLSPADRKEWKQEMDKLKKRYEAFKKDGQDFEKALNYQFGLYRGQVEEAALKFNRQTLLEQMGRVGQDFKGQDSYNEKMRLCLGYVERDLMLALSGKAREIKRTNHEIFLK